MTDAKSRSPRLSWGERQTSIKGLTISEHDAVPHDQETTMLKTIGLASIFVVGSALGLAGTASAVRLTSALTVGGSAASNVEAVRMHHRMHRMKHMRRGNPSARGWKKNF
ncbi:hypothetical protein [Methylobacterium sp. WL120]|nr:hypothetical protein [Methylobacterium sp. WL120]TXM66540.1 hypothetical protein FV229_12495 [Methylobacterium sp. WL120]